jgi:hypothetical protein
VSIAARSTLRFGSCPTYYSDSAGTAVLEAEGFPTASPTLRVAGPRPAGPLPRRGGPAGGQNEAFETHFINHLELVEVTHAASEFTGCKVIAVSERRGPGSIAAGATRERLSASDGITYVTAPSVLEGVSAQDLEDRVELVFPLPPGGDTVALVFRLRNSLLNTVPLYDIMLGDPGARSLDWQAESRSVGLALELGTWYYEDGAYGRSLAGWCLVKAGKVRDTDRWRKTQTFARVPGDELRVRLRFPADNWRIDQVRWPAGRGAWQ